MIGKYRFADRIIEITSMYPDVHEYCRDYAVEDEAVRADIKVATTLLDIRFEKEKSAETDKTENRTVINFPNGYLEELAVYRKIAEAMPKYDTFLFHGSAIAVDGEGYIFTAKSGTGKSTHTRLWRQLLGERAVMVNDDKPLIRVTDSEAVVYGTPYNGKHRLGTDIAVPIKAICILTRAPENTIEKITLSEAYPMLLQQSYRAYDVDAFRKTVELIDKMAKNISLYKLGCNMDISAAEVAYEGMKS